MYRKNGVEFVQNANKAAVCVADAFWLEIPQKYLILINIFKIVDANFCFFKKKVLKSL